MQKAAFVGFCPFEIGDKVLIEKTEEILYTETGWEKHTTQKAAVITDIATVHYLRDKKLEFRYEFDNSGEYCKTAPMRILTDEEYNATEKSCAMKCQGCTWYEECTNAR